MGGANGVVGRVAFPPPWREAEQRISGEIAGVQFHRVWGVQHPMSAGSRAGHRSSAAGPGGIGPAGVSSGVRACNAHKIAASAKSKACRSIPSRGAPISMMLICPPPSYAGPRDQLGKDGGIQQAGLAQRRHNRSAPANRPNRPGCLWQWACRVQLPLGLTNPDLKIIKSLHDRSPIAHQR